MRWKLCSKCKSTSSVDIDINEPFEFGILVSFGFSFLFLGHSCSCFAGRCLTSHGSKQFRMHVCVLGLHTFWADRVPVANSKGSKALLTEVAFWCVFVHRGVGVHADMAGTRCSFLRHESINNKRIRFGEQSELQGKPDNLKWQLIVRLCHHLPTVLNRTSSIGHSTSILFLLHPTLTSGEHPYP